MKPLKQTPELLKLANRVVWFKEPGDALEDPVHFLAYALRYGTAEDLSVLKNAGIGLEQFCEVLDDAPPGVFDLRSWNFWNLKCGRKVVPPLPVRKFD
ncbi:MAG: hypothetical protein HY280_10780 [Nitrospinae bacterium]|nr:hypothetical protein [Nitrospinota bacterium]